MVCLKFQKQYVWNNQGEGKTGWMARWNYWVMGTLRFIQLSFSFKFPIIHNYPIKISIWGQTQSVNMFNPSLTKSYDIGRVNSAEPVSYSVKWSWWRLENIRTMLSSVPCKRWAFHRGFSPPTASYVITFADSAGEGYRIFHPDFKLKTCLMIMDYLLTSLQQEWNAFLREHTVFCVTE